MSFLSAATHALGAVAGTAYDYATPGKGSSSLTNWGENYFVPQPTPASTPKTYTPAPTATANFDTSSYDKAIQASQAQIAALNAQLAAQPKLPYYNTSAAWAQAQAAAQGVVDPVYTDKLNQYLQKEQLGITQQTDAEKQQEQDIQDALTQALQDSATQRTRTGEDQTTKLGDVTTNETNYQTDEGRAFDQARTALLGNVANAGLTTSGIGQGQVQGQQTDRNQASQEQEQQFEGQRRDIQTAATRTFQDLDTSDTRSNESAVKSTASSQKALQDYIDNANLDEQSFRTSNEADRLSALASETSNQYKTQVASFINSLIGSGARSQDIALASQVYGA